ncbi:MAG: hypothetical protein AAF098_10655 [Pseudomonadota bacterium]
MNKNRRAFVLAMALLFAGYASASPLNYNEGVDGELLGATGDNILGFLGVGRNVLIGEVDATNDLFANFDEAFDGFRMSVPSDAELFAISVLVNDFVGTGLSPTSLFVGSAAFGANGPINVAPTQNGIVELFPNSSLSEAIPELAVISFQAGAGFSPGQSFSYVWRIDVRRVNEPSTPFLIALGVMWLWRTRVRAECSA